MVPSVNWHFCPVYSPFYRASNKAVLIRAFVEQRSRGRLGFKYNCTFFPQPFCLLIFYFFPAGPAF